MAYDQLIAGGLMILFGLSGMIINSYVIYAVLRNKNFGLSFGAVCVSQLAANLGNSIVFGAFVGPITLINPSIHLTYIGSRCGQILIFFWNASLFSHLLTTINRFITLYCPFNYENILTAQVTFGAIAVVWMAASCQVIPYFWMKCGVLFDTTNFTIGFQDTECSRFLGTYADFAVSITTVLIIGTIDFMSFLKIRTIQKKSYLPTPNKDIRFFFQVCTQAVAASTELLCYFWVSTFLIHNKWAFFASKTLSWITVQFIDGLVFIIFNPDMRVCRKKTQLRDPAVLEMPTKTVQGTVGAVKPRPANVKPEEKSRDVKHIDPDDITVHI